MSRKKKTKAADPEEALRMIENAPLPTLTLPTSPAPKAAPYEPTHIGSPEWGQEVRGYDPDEEADLLPSKIPPPPPVPAWTPVPASRFVLMTEDSHWFSLQDFGAVLGAMATIDPKTVLEFGPGPSTLALIEGGAVTVDTCEDSEDWARVWDERLVKRFPGVVRQHRYSWPEGAKLSIPAIDGKRFDLAFIDGPHGTGRRPDVLRYCLDRCLWVLMPAEEWKTRPVLRPLIEAIAKEAGRPVSFTTTGPMSGAFALIGPAA